MLNHRRTVLVRMPFVCAVLISFGVLFTPASGVPSAPPGTDKAVHLALFAALAATGRLAGARPASLLIGLACYAGASELLQEAFTPGRSGDVSDAAADLLGAGAGLALFRISHRWTRARHRRGRAARGRAPQRRRSDAPM